MKPSTLVLTYAALAGLVLAQVPAKPAAPGPFAQKVLTWFDAALGPGADQKGVRTLRPRLEASLAQDKNVLMLLDRDFTGGASSLLVATWAGELAAFPLTPSQAANAGLVRGRASLIDSDPTESRVRLSPAPFRLDRLDAPAGKVRGDKALPCSVVLKTEVAPKSGAIVVRIAWKESKTTRTSFRFLDGQPQDGAFKFEVPALGGPDTPVFGPVVVFVDLLLTSDQVAQGVIASNTVSFLVDVEADLDALSELGLGVMDDSVKILASVKDAATAAAALDDFRRFMTRNKAIAEAMERLNPTAEQNAAFEKKYGPRMEEVTKKLGAEVARLEATDYGTTFLNDVETVGQEKK